MGASENRYKTVIFDLGRVLVYFDFKRAYAALAPFTACPADQMSKKLFTTDLVQRLETGRIEPREFHAGFCELFGMELSYERFCESWVSIFSHELLPESLLEDIAKRYRLLLLSNTNPIHFEMIRGAYPHIGHFHELVLSYEVGALKPDEAIYRAVLERAGCKPEECFFADDIPEFVEGARRAGIDAVRFESREQLERELRNRGIVA